MAILARGYDPRSIHRVYHMDPATFNSSLGTVQLRDNKHMGLISYDANRYIHPYGGICSYYIENQFWNNYAMVTDNDFMSKAYPSHAGNVYCYGFPYVSTAEAETKGTYISYTYPYNMRFGCFDGFYTKSGKTVGYNGIQELTHNASLRADVIYNLYYNQSQANKEKTLCVCFSDNYKTKKQGPRYNYWDPNIKKISLENYHTNWIPDGVIGPNNGGYNIYSFATDGQNFTTAPTAFIFSNVTDSKFDADSGRCGDNPYWPNLFIDVTAIVACHNCSPINVGFIYLTDLDTSNKTYDQAIMEYISNDGTVIMQTNTGYGYEPFSRVDSPTSFRKIGQKFTDGIQEYDLFLINFQLSPDNVRKYMSAPFYCFAQNTAIGDDPDKHMVVRLCSEYVDLNDAKYLNDNSYKSNLFYNRFKYYTWEKE